jgi:hypothetical protein
MKWTIFHHPLSSPIYTQYEKDGFLRILRMKMMVFCVYSVWKWLFSAYTQYTQNKPSSHPIGPIEKNLVPGRPIDQIYSV